MIPDMLEIHGNILLDVIKQWTTEIEIQSIIWKTSKT